MSEIIQQMYENRSLSLRERGAILEAEAPPEVVLLADQRRLNWLERPIVLALAIGDEDDWEGGATAVDLGELLKQRTFTITDQLDWLERKQLVESSMVEGDELWQLTPAVLALIDHPVAP